MHTGTINPKSLPHSIWLISVNTVNKIVDYWQPLPASHTAAHNGRLLVFCHVNKKHNLAPARALRLQRGISLHSHRARWLKTNTSCYHDLLQTLYESIGMMDVLKQPNWSNETKKKADLKRRSWKKYLTWRQIITQAVQPAVHTNRTWVWM